jgi:aspartate aminotransferase-like enzyme
MPHHRTDEFKQAYLEVIEGLRYVLQTDNAIVVHASSGSGAMESVVVNLTRPGEKVIVTAVGKFGERWTKIAQAYGVEVVELTAEWGDPVAPETVAQAFSEHPDAVALLTTHSETSTCTLQDVEAFAGIAHDAGALIGVDGITSIGCHDVPTDEWGLDALVGGSQKGVMIPPGIGYVALSQRAIDKMTAGRHRSFYFDLVPAVKKAEAGDTPFTPAISLILALQAALKMMRDEGLEAVIARHAANAAAVRSAVSALGLELLSSQPANSATAVIAPEGRTAEILAAMEHDYGVKIAGGQERLKGRILRLGHLGFYFPVDMYTMISALEATLDQLGIIDGVGRGVEALRRSYAEMES